MFVRSEYYYIVWTISSYLNIDLLLWYYQELLYLDILYFLPLFLSIYLPYDINISVMNQCIKLYFLEVELVQLRILIVMSMFMISPFKSLFCSGIKKTSYRNNFLDLEKYSLKQSFNFKKRVGESHVLLHNMLVELFKGKHKTAFWVG